MIAYDADLPLAFSRSDVVVLSHMTTAEAIGAARGRCRALIVEGRTDSDRFSELLRGLSPDIAIWTWLTMDGCALPPFKFGDSGYEASWGMSMVPSDAFGSIVSRGVEIFGFSRAAVPFHPPRPTRGPLAGTSRRLLSDEDAELVGRLGRRIVGHVQSLTGRDTTVPFNPFSPAKIPDIATSYPTADNTLVAGALSRLDAQDFRVLDVADLVELLGYPRSISSDIGDSLPESWIKLRTLYPRRVAEALLSLVDDHLDAVNRAEDRSQS